MTRRTSWASFHICRAAAWLNLAVAGLTVLAGCRTSPLIVPPPNRDLAVVVITGRDANLQCRSADGQTLRWSAPLSCPNVLGLNRDTPNRIWITYPGPTDRNGRADVWAPDGRLLKTMTTSGRPEAGIVFTHDRACIICALSGFGGAVDVVDLDRLEVTATWAVPPPETRGAYLLTAGAASAGGLLVSGMTIGPDANRRYAVFSLFDLKSGCLTWQSSPLPGVDIWSILPYRDGFLLLNVASDESDETPPADLIFMDAHRHMERWSVARAPLWGALHGDTLFLYHNPAWNSLRDPAWRLISRTDLRNHAIEVLPLPDYWRVRDMIPQDNTFLLCVDTPAVPNQCGLHRLDWTERRITPVISIPGILRMR